ncbi:MAG: branched-chain amino acid ABC transporter permease [Candidatus Rokubacteria bacterium]|nr:branched-chain amino acid ABC transporter permease [Candidatus Rokubacteria bacterium]
MDWHPFAVAVIDGILLGGIYAAFSAGFSLVFGTMRVINLAQGELVMLGAFSAYWLYRVQAIDPFYSIPIVLGVLFLVGFGLQKLLINRIIAKEPLVSLLLTFGISLILENLALRLWTGDYRTITTSYTGSRTVVAGVTLSNMRVVGLGLAMLAMVGLFLFLTKTKIGKAIRATAQHPDAARLMGIRIHQIYALTFGVGAALAGLAGVLIALIFTIQPAMGGFYTLMSFCVVVLGGMGYVPGALVGGFVLGIIQTTSATFLGGHWMEFSIFATLLLVLLSRPAGILGKGIVE